MFPSPILQKKTRFLGITTYHCISALHSFGRIGGRKPLILTHLLTTRWISHSVFIQQRT